MRSLLNETPNPTHQSTKEETWGLGFRGGERPAAFVVALRVSHSSLSLFEPLGVVNRFWVPRVGFRVLGVAY